MGMKKTSKQQKTASLCLFFLVVLVLFSGCISIDNAFSSETTLVLPTEEMRSDVFTLPVWMNDYSSILGEYQRFADCLLDEGAENISQRLLNAREQGIFSAPSSDHNLSDHWSCMQIETNVWYFSGLPRTRAAFGYATKDLNDDGNDELILLIADYTILAIFTTVDGTPELVDAFWPKYSCAISDSGILHTHGSGGAGHWVSALQEIEQNGSTMIPIEQFGCDVEYYTVVDGERVFLSESEAEEFLESSLVLSHEDEREVTKNSGIEFVPLFG